MKSVVILPVLNLNLVGEDTLKIDKVESKKIDFKKLKEYDKIFLYDSNPYKSNFVIIKKYFKSKKYSLKKLYNILEDNITHYNNIANILNSLEDKIENVIYIEDKKDILNNK